MSNGRRGRLKPRLNAARRNPPARVRMVYRYTLMVAQRRRNVQRGVIEALIDSVEQVTKRFYSEFMKLHQLLAAQIEGLAEDAMRDQYASLMLNRLIFAYFIQKKGFLAGDTDYLKHKLEACMAVGEDGAYFRSYYTFLLMFFHEGLSKPLDARRLSHAEAAMLGSVPYLNGSVFKPHQIEWDHKDILDIPNEAFFGVFRSFDRYTWTLDTRQEAQENEINPDILGYIFEKIVNRKQMGAYYTKEDVTAYISKNTIIPFVFDAAALCIPSAFAEDGPVWELLRANPARYVYPAARQGVRHAPDTVTSIDDLITLNLDIAQFAHDVIQTCEHADLLRALYEAITHVTVLDPTCGSGAFLFAALNVLAPLYEACLDRMALFVAEDDARLAHDPQTTARHMWMREELSRAAAHGSRRYFIVKSCILHNLFGVDIMLEAVEIAKLRLLLKLVAQVEHIPDLEPLPDLDCNLRIGNALVGYARSGGMARAVKSGLDFDNARLKDELNRSLATEYRLELTNADAFMQWRATHQPFHWCAEFHDIMAGGGFDVIIGNPPYVSAADVRKNEYTVQEYVTEGCPDIYAWVLERVTHLLNNNGRSGMIVPLSLTFSRDFARLRKLLFASYGTNWFSSFARIPAALFANDVRVRNCIHIGAKHAPIPRNYTTRLHRWFEEARPDLFPTLTYAPFEPAIWKHLIPRLPSRRLSEAFAACFQQTSATLGSLLVSKLTPYTLHFKKTAYNWLNFCRTLPPCYDASGKCIPQTKFGAIHFADAQSRDLAFLFLNGKLAFAFWAIIGDDFDVTRWMFGDFPIDLAHMPSDMITRLLPYVEHLEAAMHDALSFKHNARKTVGNYNLARCRHITDQSDAIFAEYLGMTGVWQEIELLYAQIVKTNFAAEVADEASEDKG